MKKLVIVLFLALSLFAIAQKPAQVSSSLSPVEQKFVTWLGKQKHPGYYFGKDFCVTFDKRAKRFRVTCWGNITKVKTDAADKLLRAHGLDMKTMQKAKRLVVDSEDGEI